MIPILDIEEFIRPSSAGPIEDCPGRPTMEARIVALVPAIRDLEHPQAVAGTVGHAMAEQELSLIYDHGMPAGEAEQALASSYRNLDAWTRASARRCISYVIALVHRETSQDRRAQVVIERKLSGKGIEIPRGGTADVILLSRANKASDPVQLRVIVEDHKLGFLDQGHAADHLQGGCYVVMAHDKYQPDEIEVHLAQGRVRSFTAAAYDHQAIEATRRRAIAAMRAARAENPPLNPTINACCYCKALPLCAAAGERIMNARDEFALFGDSVADRVALLEARKIAQRFVEETKELQKIWAAQVQTNPNPAHKETP